MSVEEDWCEGCGVRDTGDNFNHPGLCKACNAQIMGMSPDELMKGSGEDGELGRLLAESAGVKKGEYSAWLDDSEFVELTVPLPPATIAAGKHNLQIVVDAKRSRLCISQLEPSLVLLEVEPLFDAVSRDHTWYIEKQKGWVTVTLEKQRAGPWGGTLCREGGVIECWEGARGFSCEAKG